jgi:hypothetical protein
MSVVSDSNYSYPDGSYPDGGVEGADGFLEPAYVSITISLDDDLVAWLSRSGARPEVEIVRIIEAEMEADIAVR